jgi:hypothetical protein
MKIKDLVINGMKVEKDIVRFNTPSNNPTGERTFWKFFTEKGSVIYATGNISFEMIPEEGEIKWINLKSQPQK